MIADATIPARHRDRSGRKSNVASATLSRTVEEQTWSADIGTASLLIVDDEPGSVQVLSRMLAGFGHLRFALTGAEALALAQAAPPDLMLVDAEMPGMNGFEFCARVRTDPVLKEVPVIIVTSHGEVATEVAGFAAGAADFIRKPPTAEVVQARVRTQLRLKFLTDTLRRAALTDGLTGLANRRHFDDVLRMECDRARRNGEPISLLMIDVDHFKRYNDQYGHPAGDICLRQVAAAMQSVLHRPTDCLARYGGEEFALLLPGTEQTGAALLAQRVVDAVAALQMPHADSPLGGTVTVSAGASTARRAGERAHALLSQDALVQAADHALYEAKAAGRARCVWQSTTSGNGSEACA